MYKNGNILSEADDMGRRKDPRGLEQKPVDPYLQAEGRCARD